MAKPTAKQKQAAKKAAAKHKAAVQERKTVKKQQAAQRVMLSGKQAAKNWNAALTPKQATSPGVLKKADYSETPQELLARIFQENDWSGEDAGNKKRWDDAELERVRAVGGTAADGTQIYGTLQDEQAGRESRATESAVSRGALHSSIRQNAITDINKDITLRKQRYKDAVDAAHAAYATRNNQIYGHGGEKDAYIGAENQRIKEGEDAKTQVPGYNPWAVAPGTPIGSAPKPSTAAHATVGAHGGRIHPPQVGNDAHTLAGGRGQLRPSVPGRRRRSTASPHNPGGRH